MHMQQAAVARVRALPYELLDVEARRFEEEDYGRVFKVLTNLICLPVTAGWDRGMS